MRRRGEVISTSSPTKRLSEVYEFKFESELRDLQKIIETTVKSSIDVGSDLAEMGHYEESQEFLEEDLKDLIRLERRTRHESTLVNDFTNHIRTSNEEGERVLNSLKGVLDNEISLRWRDVEEVKEYNELTWECGPGFGNRQAYPVINEEGDYDDGGIVMQSRDSLICPISQGLLKDPVRNPPCNHSYSREMIEGLFPTGSNHPIQCPVSGCRAVIVKRELVADEKLEKKLKRAQNRIFK